MIVVDGEVDRTAVQPAARTERNIEICGRGLDAYLHLVDGNVFPGRNDHGKIDARRAFCIGW